MRCSFLAALLAISVLLPPGALRADAQPTVTAEMERLVKDLDADAFAQRQAASQRLGEMGRSAFPALEAAAAGESREAATRALELLKKHLDGGDESTKATAKETLERLAKSSDGAVARRASEALAPPKPVSIAMPINVAPRLVRPQIQVRANFNRGGNIVRRVSTRIINGVRQVEAEENGRKIKLVDDPAKGIDIEVTEGGKTQKYAAKNAAELKTKHPDGHKIYEQYAPNVNGVQIRIQGGIQLQPGQGFPPRNVPNVVPRPAVPLPPAAAPAAGKDAALQSIDRAIESIERTIAQQRERGEAGQRMVESLETTRQRFLETRARMAER